MDAARVRRCRERAVAFAQKADALEAGAQSEEWEIVVRFYAALHLVDAYFETKDSIKPKPANHFERGGAIRNSAELCQASAPPAQRNRFRNAYKRLHEMSEQVRYDAAYAASATDFRTARADFSTIRAFLNPVLDKSAPTTKPATTIAAAAPGASSAAGASTAVAGGPATLPAQAAKGPNPTTPPQAVAPSAPAQSDKKN